MRGAFAELEILSADALAAPLTQSCLSDRAPAQREHVDDWRPTTVGEVLFHLWD